MNREKAALLELRYAFPERYDACPCPRMKCERHGRCTECWNYHFSKKKLPYCLRKKQYREEFLGKFAVG